MAKKHHRKAHRNRLRARQHYRTRKNAFRYDHRRRRSHHYTNPFSTRGLSRSAVPLLIGAGGAILTDIAIAYLPLPAQLQSGWMNLLTRAAVAVGVGFIGSKVAGRETGKALAAGGLTVVAYSGLKQVLAPTLGTSIKGLSGLADFGDYRATWPGEYAVGASPSSWEDRPQLSRMGAYMAPSVRYPSRMGRLGAYMQPRGLGAYMNPGTFLQGGAPSSIAAKQRMAGFGSFNGTYSEDM